MAITDAGRKRIRGLPDTIDQAVEMIQRGQRAQESVDDILADDLRVEKPESPMDAFDRGQRDGYAQLLQETRDELREADAHRRILLHKIADLRAMIQAAPETRELL